MDWWGMFNRLLMAGLLGFALAWVGAPGAQEPAPADSLVGRAGAGILAAVGGRDAGAAYAQSRSVDNPFAVDVFGLARALSLAFVAVDPSTPVGDGQLSLILKFDTLDGRFLDASQTPAVMPFAFMKDGACHGGYVTGHPVPDTVLGLDMAGKPCSAASVQTEVGALYTSVAREWHDPIDTQAAMAAETRSDFDAANVNDFQLELILYAAYGGARSHAMEHANYFLATPADLPDLRGAVGKGLREHGYEAVAVAEAEAPDFNAMLACAPEGQVLVRLRGQADGAGLTLAVASHTRLTLYDYNPQIQADVVITAPRTCQQQGLD